MTAKHIYRKRRIPVKILLVLGAVAMSRIATTKRASALVVSNCKGRQTCAVSVNQLSSRQISILSPLSPPSLCNSRFNDHNVISKRRLHPFVSPSSPTRLFSGSDAAIPKTLRTLDKYYVGEEGSGYYVYEWEQTIKKSRFIGLARYADDWKDASDFVQNIRSDLHPKARHWCFAYRGSVASGSCMDGDGETTSTITERASDDGEPSGTAGQPILNALRTETDADGGLVDVVLVVIRYSGGIKLGAGGLIRAYGGTARSVLQEFRDAQVDVIPKTQLSLSSIQPKHVGVVYELAAKHGGTVEATSDDYTSFVVTCDFAAGAKLSEQLLDATRGSAVIR